MSSTTTGTRRSFNFPLELQIEPRMDSPRWLAPLVSLVAVLLALVMGAVVLALVGGNPFRAYAHIAGAAFGSLGVFSDTLVKATPLIFTGTACAVAFKMKLWNIGAEGQFFMGALGASIVILAGVVSEDASKVVTLAVMAFAGRAVWCRLGVYPGHIESAVGSKRNHYDTDAELHCVRAGQLLYLWRLERGRLSNDADLSAPPPGSRGSRTLPSSFRS